eukprot:jgi/Ulvmu1/1907/UM012_0066.1
MRPHATCAAQRIMAQLYPPWLPVASVNEFEHLMWLPVGGCINGHCHNTWTCLFSKLPSSLILNPQTPASGVNACSERERWCATLSCRLSAGWHDQERLQLADICHGLQHWSAGALEHVQAHCASCD